MRDRSAYDRARWAARIDVRPTICAARGCDQPLVQPKRGMRLYHDTNCKERAWYAANYVSKPRTDWDTSAPPLPEPYQGHKWLEMAREAAGVLHTVINGTEITDRYYDDVGEALLALMEGRDPDEAVREYRRREFAARRLTTHMSDWKDYRLEAIMPTVESAEDAYMETQW